MLCLRIYRVCIINIIPPGKENFLIILDKPYVSEFLKQTIILNGYPVIKTAEAKAFNLGSSINFAETEYAAKELKQNSCMLYANSENAIGWINKHLSSTPLPKQIEYFKDKIKFRELIKPLYPGFFFRKVAFSSLSSLDISKLKKPFIIKPAVGFFSMGVHKVTSNSEWSSVLSKINAEMAEVKELYPKAVLNSTNFIIEECIEGEEYAVDAYYNIQGKPVIVNALRHLFASDKDTSDRVYITSTKVVNEIREPVLSFLGEIGKPLGLKNFPLHLEVRISENDAITPIELNPMRFAGWCTTDIANYAYGINPYECFFSQLEPCWEKNKDDGNIYSIVVLDKTADINASEIERFDYQKLLSNFQKPLELRRVDYTKYPVFGFLFAKTNSITELEYILKSDLKEFIVFK